MASDGARPLLSIEDLHTWFYLDEGIVRAVNGVSLTIPHGKTLGVVGESGCGKSVTAFSVLQLIARPGRIVSGRITLRPTPAAEPVVLSAMKPDGRPIRKVRGNQVAMIFQEPMSSLSPVHTVGSQIMEAVRLHTPMGKVAARQHTIAMMARVGIPDPGRRFGQYPHEMSGGLRQRAVIAMALSCRPALLIADEPTTALDVTIQAQILDLMRDLQAELGMSIMLITHDLGVVAQMADEVAVMYMGRVVEQATTARIFADPLHPYTRGLMKSMPPMTRARRKRLDAIAGSVPEPLARIAGCPFHPRCPEAIAGKCNSGEPPALEAHSPAHQVACWARSRVF